MADNLQYRVSSREIIDLMSAMRSRRLTRSPFFQRNLVWRETHKREFIETIMAGLPFPQIFLARGKIDVEAMEAYTCVVDGQQRLTAIDEYILNKFPVHGKLYSDLDSYEKEQFLKYKVAVIDFDLLEDDPRLREIFQRLNRTYYSLSTVEKVASEYSGSEFMVTARAILGDFSAPPSDNIENDVGEKEDNPFLIDPSLPATSIAWAKAVDTEGFTDLLRGDGVFSNYEASRQVPLMFVLTIIATLTFGNYFNRTDRVREYLEVYNDEYGRRDQTIDDVRAIGRFLKVANLSRGSFWFRKANFFTLCVEVGGIHAEPSPDIIDRLKKFADNPPSRYVLAQREAVNSRRERVLRAEYFRAYVLEGRAEEPETSAIEADVYDIAQEEAEREA